MKQKTKTEPNKMFMVTYGSLYIGLVAANSKTVKRKSLDLCKSQTKLPSNSLYGIKVDSKNIKVDDSNSANYQHMLEQS